MLRVYHFQFLDFLEQLSHLLMQIYQIALNQYQLFENLFSVLISKKPEPDFYEQRLQLHFVERINILIEEEKLNPIIKANLLDLKKNIKIFASIRSIFSIENNKSHFKYLKKLSK